jgi:hypothetical protein
MVEVSILDSRHTVPSLAVAARCAASKTRMASFPLYKDFCFFENCICENGIFNLSSLEILCSCTIENAL